MPLISDGFFVAASAAGGVHVMIMIMMDAECDVSPTKINYLMKLVVKRTGDVIPGTLKATRSTSTLPGHTQQTSASLHPRST